MPIRKSKGASLAPAQASPLFTNSYSHCLLHTRPLPSP